MLIAFPSYIFFWHRRLSWRLDFCCPKCLSRSSERAIREVAVSLPINYYSVIILRSATTPKPALSATASRHIGWASVHIFVSSWHPFQPCHKTPRAGPLSSDKVIHSYSRIRPTGAAPNSKTSKKSMGTNEGKPRLNPSQCHLDRAMTPPTVFPWPCEEMRFLYVELRRVADFSALMDWILLGFPKSWCITRNAERKEGKPHWQPSRVKSDPIASWARSFPACTAQKSGVSTGFWVFFSYIFGDFQLSGIS